jgi:hypothetical protein
VIDVAKIASPRSRFPRPVKPTTTKSLMFGAYSDYLNNKNHDVPKQKDFEKKTSIAVSTRPFSHDLLHLLDRIVNHNQLPDVWGLLRSFEQ